MADNARQDIQSRQHFAKADNNNNTTNQTRQLSHIDPAQISKSFRRICNRDFHDVEDKYHTPEQRRRNRGSDQYHFAVRSNDTLDAIDQEQKLLSFNLPTTGALLDQFVSSLGRILQWEPILTSRPISSGRIENNNNNNKRRGFVYLFAQFILGAMDFADHPFSYKFLGVPMGEAPLSFITTFFAKLDPGKVLWFQAIEEETE